jgi:hypothetical protein
LARFEVIMALKTSRMVFWVVMPCDLQVESNILEKCTKADENALRVFV